MHGEYSKTYLARLDQSLLAWKHYFDGGQNDNYHHGGNPEVYHKSGKCFLCSGFGMIDCKEGNKYSTSEKNFIYTNGHIFQGSGWKVGCHLRQDI